MRISRILWVVALVGLFSVAAKADTADPHVIINDPVSCASSGSFSTTSGISPLVLSGLGCFNFDYTGANDLTELYVEVYPIPVPGIYDCTSNIFSSCQPYAPPANNYGLEFYLSGGSISPNSTITAIVSTPEPATLLMLLAGLISLGILGRKRRRVITAA